MHFIRRSGRGWSGRAPTSALTGLVLVAGLALLFAVIILPLTARSVDEEAFQEQTLFVQRFYQQALNGALSVVESNALWDAMVSHVTPRANESWLTENLITSGVNDLFHQTVLIFDPGDAFLFGRRLAKPIPDAELAQIGQVLRPALQRLRSLEAQKLAARRADPALPGAIRLAANLRLNDEVFAALLCRIESPASGTASRSAGKGPVVVVLVPVRSMLIPDLTQRLLLKEARLEISPVAHPHRVATPLQDADDHTVAYLSWQPRAPGRTLLHRMLPVELGVIFLFAAILVVVYSRGRQGAVALARSEAEATRLAYHDQLTGLPNRRFVQERLQLALESGSLALICLDLDRFKFVNDTYGHLKGDELLQEIGFRLSAICGGQSLCARLGGDEFVVMATDCDAEQACGLASRICADIARPAQLGNVIVQVNACAGISLFSPQTEAPSAEEILRRADVALYKAKALGAGEQCVFHPDLDETSRLRRELETELRVALETNQIRVEYQPQYGPAGLSGVEALARWTLAGHGPVSPAYFVRLAEDIGLIEQLGFTVLSIVFQDARHWPALSVSVNLSARQLQSRTFLAALDGLVASLRANPRQFEFEITETVLVQDDPLIRETILGLRDRGFRLALDDFGTGYSSLGYVHRLPISRVKIDRSFVSPLPGDRAAEALITAIVGFCGALSLELVAEGVETASQLDSLARLGCFTVQGYLTGKPMPAREIDGLLHQVRPAKLLAGAA